MPWERNESYKETQEWQEGIERVGWVKRMHWRGGLTQRWACRCWPSFLTVCVILSNALEMKVATNPYNERSFNIDHVMATIVQLGQLLGRRRIVRLNRPPLWPDIHPWTLLIEHIVAGRLRYCTGALHLSRSSVFWGSLFVCILYSEPALCPQTDVHLSMVPRSICHAADHCLSGLAATNSIRASRNAIYNAYHCSRARDHNGLLQKTDHCARKNPIEGQNNAYNANTT